jgi:hypothetical protein
MGLDFITAAAVSGSQPVWKAAAIGSFICLLSLISREVEASASQNRMIGGSIARAAR